MIQADSASNRQSSITKTQGEGGKAWQHWTERRAPAQLTREKVEGQMSHWSDTVTPSIIRKD